MNNENIIERRRQEAEQRKSTYKRKRDIAKKVALLLVENKVTLAEMDDIFTLLRYQLEVSLPKSP